MLFSKDSQSKRGYESLLGFLGNEGDSFSSLATAMPSTSLADLGGAMAGLTSNVAGGVGFADEYGVAAADALSGFITNFAPDSDVIPGLGDFAQTAADAGSGVIDEVTDFGEEIWDTVAGWFD